MDYGESLQEIAKLRQKITEAYADIEKLKENALASITTEIDNLQERHKELKDLHKYVKRA